MKQEANWYSLNMLPTYLMMGKEQLRESEGQLKNLQSCREKPYVLDDHLVNRIIKVHTEQNEMLWVLIEQCRKWREQSPSKDQLADIVQTENNFQNLKKTNEQVLDLAERIKKWTIDSILRKDEAELAIDYLLGNIKI